MWFPQAVKVAPRRSGSTAGLKELLEQQAAVLAAPAPRLLRIRGSAVAAVAAVAPTMPALAVLAAPEQHTAEAVAVAALP
jgi:hypothetical protein